MSGITKVVATEEELAQGEWSTENLRILLEAMHSDGIVVLENVVDCNHLDKINEFMEKDALRIRKETNYLNFGTENIQQGPPIHVEELNYDDFLLNKLLHEAVSHVLGPGAKWDFVSGNTALPKSTKRQPVHSDDSCPYMQRTFYVVANIPLIETSPENGATEFWPGTHRFRDLGNYNEEGEGHTVKKIVLEERRKVRPPVQPHIKQGSIVIRDLMLWHCGMPNPSDQIRCMPALGFSAKWWKNDTKFKVPNERVQDHLVNGATESGITARTRIITGDFNREKDLHDFNLNEQ